MVLVNDPLDTVHEVADAYDIHWLVLDRATRAVAGPILDGDERPAWVGPPIAQFQIDADGTLQRHAPGIRTGGSLPGRLHDR